MRRHIVAGTKLHAEDNLAAVLGPGNGKTEIGRRGQHPARRWATFEGALQADGFGGCRPHCGAGRVREAACWAHVQRKF